MATSPLLSRTVEHCIEQAGRWFAPIFDDALHRLLEPGAVMSLGLPRIAAAETIELLQRNRRDLLQGFERELAKQMRADVAPRPEALSELMSLGDLQLVDEAQAEEDVEVLRLIQRVDSEAEAELRGLQARTSTLRGDDAITARSSPLRPELIGRALWTTLAAQGGSTAARVIALRLATTPVVTCFRQAATELRIWLETQGVSAAAYRVVPMSAGHVASPPNSGFDITRPGALDELLAVAVPGSRGGRAVVANVDGGLALSNEARQRLAAPLMRAIEQMPAPVAAPNGPVPNVIRAHQRHLESAARNEDDRQVVELLAQLFERMLNDARLLPATRARLGRLQATVLRLTLGERSILDDHAHPTWRLLMGIATHTLGYSAATDPRAKAFFEAIDPLIATLTGDTTPTVGKLADTLKQIESICSRALREEQSAASAAIERLRQAERRDALQQVFRDRLHRVIAQPTAAAVLTPTLRAFLISTWARVAAETALREGDSAPAVAQCIATASDLVESLKPLRSREERARLLALVRSLAARLQDGMRLIGLPEPEREAVLGELLERHSAALKAGPRSGTAEPTPEEIVRRLREEGSDDHDDDPRRRVGGDSLIDEGSLDTVPAEFIGEDTGRLPRGWLERIAPGLWCELFVRGHWSAARLLWVSESRQHWLFSVAPGVTHSLTERALRRLADAGLLGPLEERNLLERAVDALLADVGAAPVHAG